MDGVSMSKSEDREHQIGEQASCQCGAAFEFGSEGRVISKKDDARCRYCLTLLTSWPQPLPWRAIRWPRAVGRSGAPD
jgi:hypothetical protein